jgi:hypothetical protein
LNSQTFKSKAAYALGITEEANKPRLQRKSADPHHGRNVAPAIKPEDQIIAGSLNRGKE